MDGLSYDTWSVILKHMHLSEHCKLQCVNHDMSETVGNYRMQIENDAVEMCQKLPGVDTQLCVKFMYLPLSGWSLQCRTQDTESLRYTPRRIVSTCHKLTSITNKVSVEWKKKSYLVIRSQHQRQQYTCIDRLKIPLAASWPRLR